jgi:DDE superfamily endonuclease
MEDVLDVYTRPYDPARPVVCLDETSRQLLGDTRPALPPAPGRAARSDPEYVRGGVANIFLVIEPLRGWRQVRVSDQRTRIDWAHCVKDLVDVHYPAAETIVLVMDQLNTHSPASLYATFPPTEAKRLADKLEIHSTPKHGSWLNMAELELSVLERQCLRRRLADRPTMERELAAWVTARNAVEATIDWRFATADARIKLKRLYPAFQP